MDPLTHGVLGATLARAGFAARLGPRALGWGALAAMLPDVDIVVIPLLGPFAEWRYHRGLTHALWFGLLAGAALAWVLWRRHGRTALGWWTSLLVLTSLSHPLLDWCTTYGTQLLWPFSHRRFAVDAVAIIDPIYTALLLAALAASWGNARARRAGYAAAVGVALSTAYLAYGYRLNRHIEDEARRQLAARDAAGATVRAYPTLLQPWLRRVVARQPGEVRVGFMSSLAPEAATWSTFVPDHGPLVEAVRATPEGALLEWFARGETAAHVQPHGTSTVVELDDLRYGMPGEPRRGLWGIRAAFDASGRLQGAVERFRRPRPAGVFSWIWHATFPR